MNKISELFPFGVTMFIERKNLIKMLLVFTVFNAGLLQADEQKKCTPGVKIYIYGDKKRCPPCRALGAYIDELKKKYPGGFEVIIFDGPEELKKADPPMPFNGPDSAIPQIRVVITTPEPECKEIKENREGPGDDFKKWMEEWIQWMARNAKKNASYSYDVQPAMEAPLSLDASDGVIPYDLEKMIAELEADAG